MLDPTQQSGSDKAWAKAQLELLNAERQKLLDIIGPEPFENDQCPWVSIYRDVLLDVNRLYLPAQTRFPISEKARSFSKLVDICQDFMSNVKRYGKIIISEYTLENSRQTINPQRVGGRAGGSKFIVQGILFKVATIQDSMYPDVHYAAKAASHDMKGCTQFYDAIQEIPEICEKLFVPLMTTLDYKGRRLLAMTLLPISDNTRVYGSSAGGSDFRNNEVVSDMLEKIAKQLNFESYKYSTSNMNDNESEGLTIHSIWDLEVHYIPSQSSYFALDFGNVLPPQASSPLFPEKLNKHLYQKLRPNFVKTFSQPICPDFRTERESQRRATDFLINVLIPFFTKKLPNLLSEYTQTNGERYSRFSLSQKMHFAGINCRFLGYMYKMLKGAGEEYQESRNLVLVEIISRTLKGKIRARLREVTAPSGTPAHDFRYKAIIVTQLNKYFEPPANNSQSNSFTKLNRHGESKIVTLMNDYFPKAFENAEEFFRAYNELKDYRFQRFLNISAPRLILDKLLKMTGIKIYSEKLSERGLLSTLISMDVKDIGQITKTMPIVSLGKGFYLKYLVGKQCYERSEKMALALRALNNYEKAFDFWPHNPEVLRSIGYMLHMAYEERSQINLQRVSSCFEMALDFYPDDISALYYYCLILISYKEYQRAFWIAIKLLELSPTQQHCSFLCELLKWLPGKKKFLILM